MGDLSDVKDFLHFTIHDELFWNLGKIVELHEERFPCLICYTVSAVIQAFLDEVLYFEFSYFVSFLESDHYCI